MVIYFAHGVKLCAEGIQNSYIDGDNMQTTRTPDRGVERANKIYVNTTYSSDGRSLEGYWMDYDSSKTPEATYALFLLERVLNQSEGVDYYSLYDENGNRDSRFRKENQPKRI